MPTIGYIPYPYLEYHRFYSKSTLTLRWQLEVCLDLRVWRTAVGPCTHTQAELHSCDLHIARTCHQDTSTQKKVYINFTYSWKKYFMGSTITSVSEWKFIIASAFKFVLLRQPEAAGCCPAIRAITSWAETSGAWWIYLLSSIFRFSIAVSRLVLQHRK